jgi:hypothetical protein
VAAAALEHECEQPALDLAHHQRVQAGHRLFPKAIEQGLEAGADQLLDRALGEIVVAEQRRIADRRVARELACLVDLLAHPDGEAGPLQPGRLRRRAALHGEKNREGWLGRRGRAGGGVGWHGGRVINRWAGARQGTSRDFRARGARVAERHRCRMSIVVLCHA